MSRGQNPFIWMVAISLPGAAHALGLGDIHVDSALNDCLVAEIDIVDSTADELAGLKASVANREAFLRYGADRPGFLSSVTFKVSSDSHGRPVLAVRSTESFSEPLVNFLVEVRWNRGALIREYTLLLDPPAYTPARQADAAPAVAAPIAAPIATPAPAPATGKATQFKVGAKGTLRGIAWRAGARSKSDLQRMMLAIFRANPKAFDGNINRLHRGATISIPPAADIAAIPRAEAKREIRAQMAAWRPSLKARAAVQNAQADPALAPPTDESAVLNLRVQSLEQQLADLKQLLYSEHEKMLGIQTAVARAEVSAPAQVSAPAVSQPKLPAKRSLPTWVLAGLGLMALALGALYVGLRRHARKIVPPRRAKSDDSVADTVKLPVPAADDVTQLARQDPILLDRDITSQHVQMPSILNQRVAAKERRTNLADALKLAIEREPDRHDLNLRLLEHYYSATATNRQAFLELVQEYADNRDAMPPGEWERIAFMGRQIAADNPMFDIDSTSDDEVAA